MRGDASGDARGDSAKPWPIKRVRPFFFSEPLAYQLIAGRVLMYEHYLSR